MKLSEELRERGFIHQFSSDTLEEIVDGPPRTLYWGVDPTADSIHTGNFVHFALFRHFIDHGHTVIVLVGGGTGLIGDPKPDKERSLLEPEVIQERVNRMSAQGKALLGSENIRFVDNREWLEPINLIAFLRDIGKYFTVNELIKKDAIANRLKSEEGISYTEFAYPLLQAFDYLKLHREYGCDLQTGGSDQWGNIIAGVDLIRRKEQKTVYAITVPLVIDKTTGKKFGKSEGNAVWLDPEQTSPYEFYQFWLNTADENVIDYLKLFTFLSLEEIAEIEKEFRMDPGSRLAQRRLAHEVTTFVHGEDTTAAVEKVSALLFGEGSVGELSEEERTILRANAPTTAVSTGEELTEVLVRSGLASSKREARTFIESGAITFGAKRIESVDAVITEEQFAHGIALLRRGKRQVIVLTL